MPESDFQQRDGIEVGDLVTYRSIQELSEQNFQQKILIHGIGVVVSMDDEYSKVYWIHAKQFLWVITNKLTTFKNLTEMSPRY